MDVNHEFAPNRWNISCMLPKSSLSVLINLLSARHNRKVPSFSRTVTHLAAHKELDLRIIPLSASFLTFSWTASASSGEKCCCFTAIGAHSSSIRGILNYLTVHGRTLFGSSGNSPATLCGCSTLRSWFPCPTLS